MNRAELDRLLHEAVTVAQEFLAKSGEFYPFCLVLAANGKIALAAGATGEEHPASADVIEVLLDGLRMGAANGEYRATALTADVRLSGRNTDAIRVTLEDSDGTAIHCFVPYSKSPAGLTYGESFASAAEAHVFAGRSN